MATTLNLVLYTNCPHYTEVTELKSHFIFWKKEVVKRHYCEGKVTTIDYKDRIGVEAKCTIHGKLSFKFLKNNLK